MAGAPLGNKNGAKGRRWLDALNKALAQFATEDGKIQAGYALDAIAQQVVQLAVAGNWDAIQEIGNRLDGKPAQSVQLQDPDGLPIGLAVAFGRAISDDRVSSEARMPLSS